MQMLATQHRWRNPRHWMSVKKKFGQVQFGARCSLISLKQQASKQTSRKSHWFCDRGCFLWSSLDGCLPGIQLYQQQVWHNLSATENRFCCCYITLWSHCFCFSVQTKSCHIEPDLPYVCFSPETGLPYRKELGCETVGETENPQLYWSRNLGHCLSFNVTSLGFLGAILCPPGVHLMIIDSNDATTQPLFHILQNTSKAQTKYTTNTTFGSHSSEQRRKPKQTKLMRLYLPPKTLQKQMRVVVCWLSSYGEVVWKSHMAVANVDSHTATWSYHLILTKSLRVAVSDCVPAGWNTNSPFARPNTRETTPALPSHIASAASWE